ncbi:glucose-6-phosphate dehydrogenase [Simiduia litorea]|uniref:glucose-6-phosphate dehydrogenase n=1 Tax=Simiduia litorea TaxID=1435348 RepID=UPI0036F1CC5C
MQATDWVIFGGTGDLSMRKLMPALYRCEEEGRMVEGSRVLATSRGSTTQEEFVQTVKNALQKFLRPGEFEESTWAKFAERLFIVNVDLSDVASWRDMAELLKASEATPVYYLAIPPSLFGGVCATLSSLDLVSERARVIVEKPLGYDRESAEAINSEIALYFTESQVFRIDHYLGKESVQNLLALRFANRMFENIWDANSIDHVQITLAESVGVESRGGFYDGAGAMRDMVQNHLLQLLCFVAMDPPNALDADSVRSEKIKVLRSLRKITGEDIGKHTVRAQYVDGEAGGKAVDSYIGDLGKPSRTETFVAIRAFVDNWRWKGVPFYLRTGKRMSGRYAEMVIQFKPVTHSLFGSEQNNQLVIRLQPEEHIYINLMSKDIASADVKLRPIEFEIDLAAECNAPVADAYKRLMLDAMTGNGTLFVHREEVDYAWRWADPIIAGWKKNLAPLSYYAAGTNGPESSEDLMADDNRQWHVQD